jgi:hypothetical protein
MYGVIDFTRIDTSPGGGTALSPPLGWAGDYRKWARDQWRNNPGFRQHAVVVAHILRRGEQAVFVGPNADVAARIVKSIR